MANDFDSLVNGGQTYITPPPPSTTTNNENPDSKQNPARGKNGAPAPTIMSGPTVSQLSQTDKNNQYIGRGRQTVFGLNYNGTVDQGDNGIGAFNDPSTGRPYDTRNPKLVGASLNEGIFSGTIGNYLDPKIRAAVSAGKYQVQVTTDNGRSVKMPLVDNGPALWTGNAVDVTKGAADMLGIKENSVLNYQIIGPDGQPMPIKNAPPVPTTANPAGESRGTQYRRVLDQYNAEKNLYNPTSIKAASPDTVEKWDYAIANNLVDPNSIPFAEKLSIALAKDPMFLVKDENAEILKDVYVKKMPGIAEQLAQGFSGLLPATQKFLGDLGAAGSASAYNAKAFAETMWNKGAGMVNSVYGSNIPKAPEPDMGTVYKNAASGINGVVQGVGDAINMMNGIPQAVESMGLPIALHFTQDPVAREQLLDQYTKDLQANLRGQINAVQVGKTIQQNAADVMKFVGATNVAEALSHAKPDANVQGGVSSVANPINWIPFGEGAGSSIAKTPSFFERATELVKKAGGDAAVADTSKALSETPNGIGDLVSKPLPNPVADASSNDVGKLIGQTQATARADAQTAARSAQEATQGNALVTKYLNSSTGMNSYVGYGLQKLGQGVNGLGDAAQMYLKAPDWIASKFTSNPLGQQGIARAIRYGLQDLPGELMGFSAGGPLGMFIGGAAADVAQHLSPDVLRATGEFLRTAGKELTYGQATLPYWNRVAQSLNGLPKYVAQALDNPLVYAMGDAAKGAVSGTITGGAIGALSSPTTPYASAVMNAGQGAMFGMAGGGFGQVVKYKNPAQYAVEMKGDWNRYRDMLGSDERTNFNKLSPTDQLTLSQFSHHFPGLKVNYFNKPNGVWGYHNGDTIGINTAMPGSAVKAVITHELAHSVAQNGMLPKLYSELLGDPSTKTPGQYTLLDKSAPDGVAHVDPNTGRYQTNQDFQNLKSEYITRLGEKGEPTSQIDDKSIAREIFAEHGSDYMLSGDAIADAHSAFRPGFMFSSSAYKQAMMKMGTLFDREGGIVKGTGIFSQSLKDNENLNNLVKGYFKTRFHEAMMSPEDTPDREFTKEDLKQNGNVDKWFDNSPSVRRNSKGEVQKDAGGMPLFRSDKEVRQYNSGFTKTVNEWIKGLPEDRQADLGIQKRGENNYFMRYMPDELIDHLASKNQYNPRQIEMLRSLSKTLADKDQAGREANMFYQTASRKGNRYATLAGTERNFTPYGLSTTNDGNTIIHGVDFAQLTNNFLKFKDRNQAIGQAWKEPNDFYKDAQTYFDNHANGRPGATGIGEQKRDMINALSGLGTNENRDRNPFVARVQNARSIIKDFRIDRVNRLNFTDRTQPFTGEEQYYRYLNPNFTPGSDLGDGEKIKAAAVKLGGKIFTGINHSEAYSQALKDGSKNVMEDYYNSHADQEGFTTSSDRFVSRREAWKIASASRQTWKKSFGSGGLAAENITY